MRLSILALMVTAVVSPLNAQPSYRVMISPPQDASVAPAPWHALFNAPDQWAQTRSKIKAVAYADHALESIDDATLGVEVRQLQAWGLDLVLESGALKGECGTGLACFAARHGLWDRVRAGGGTIAMIAMDEPFNCGTKPVGNGCGFTDLNGAAEETANFIQQVRTNYPGVRIMDIEPIPQFHANELQAWVTALNARCAAKGVRGIDEFAIDLDWARSFAYSDIFEIRNVLQNSGIPVTIIYWSARPPWNTDADWYYGLNRQLGSLQLSGAITSSYWVNDWLAIPHAIVPETTAFTFTNSVRDFIDFVEHGSNQFIPGCEAQSLSFCASFTDDNTEPPVDPGCTQTRPSDAPILNGPTGCFSQQRPIFSWSPVDRADEYILAVFDVTGGGEDLVYFGGTPATSMQLPFNLGLEKRYRWKVKARNCAGSAGFYSGNRFFTVSANCIPPQVAPTLNAPQGCITSVRPTFTWSAVPTANWYRIVVSPADHDDFFIDQFPTGTSLVSPVDLAVNVAYRFKVRAINDAGIGPWSDSMYFTPYCGGVATNVTAPLGCTATTTPTFTWLPAPQALDYWLLVANSPDFSAPTTTWYVNASTTGTSYSPGVTFVPNMTYYTKVKTHVAPGSVAGSWSPTVSFVPGCIPNQPPVARAGGPYSGSPGQAIQFNGAASTDPDGTVVSYAWTFGDGATGNGSQPTHAYSPVGTYTVTLTVTDNSGATAAASTTAEVRVAPVPENVTWTNAAGVSVSANNLTDTMSTAGWYAGASSTRAIASGDGAATFTVAEVNTYRMAGLSHLDIDVNYQSIDFAIYPSASGMLYVYENGTGLGPFGSYATGDILQVAIESGVVRYKRNSTIVYSSAIRPVYPLVVDASLYSPGATINQVTLSGALTAAPPIEPVTWTNTVGVAATGNSLSDTSTVGWIAGASSTKGIASGDGFAAFTATETSTHRMFGLSHVDADANYTSIDFALYLTDASTLSIYEKGVYRGGFGAYGAGDRLEVVIRSGMVQYQRNGNLLYTSTQVPVYPLVVDTSLYSPGATISQATLSGQLLTVPPCSAFAPDVTTAAAAIFGGQAYPGQSGANAFDNIPSYCSLYTSSGTYVGQDFGFTPRDVRKVRFFGTSSYGFNAKLQYSDDAMSWRETGLIVNVPPGTQAWQEYAVNPSGAHRYWRFLDLGGYAFLQIDEIEMLECGPSINTSCLTLAGDVTTILAAIFGGQAYPGQDGKNAFDNVPSYCSLYTSSGTYVGQDFGSTPRDIRKVRFFGTSSYGFNAKLQYSDDGRFWSETGLTVNVPPGNQSWLEYAVNPSGAHRYWRFLDLGGYAFLQIDEIEMLACAG